MAREVHQVARDLQECTTVGVACLSCREPKEPQLEDLEKCPQICIATPSRLLAFLKEGRLRLFRCTYVVLDGADRIVDMGLEVEIQAIAEWIRPDHQTQIWLTSLTHNVHPLCEDLLDDYVQVSIGVKPAPRALTVEQVVFVGDEAEKSERLIAILQDILNKRHHKVIVFVESKQAVDRLVGMLVFRDFPAIGIHSKRRKKNGTGLLPRFAPAGAPILVSTDLGAQELDATGGVRFVINYDYPTRAEGYMRRLNHVSHPHEPGVAYTFFAHHDRRHAADLVFILREAKQQIPDELKEFAKSELGVL
ncbi:probable ATP-dependent RNA helicase DDX5 [Dermacentor silvarum]|uniref:probable ATP-dependent RNA helicase DDX5 n=1 Tax=Dermacentor silvarum TaxID=543639 RepID=UPI00189866A8|nr:probable ATP-dependent RNA helicase DDX5 [Dermacentor silvarum]